MLYQKTQQKLFNFQNGTIFGSYELRTSVIKPTLTNRTKSKFGSMLEGLKKVTFSKFAKRLLFPINFECRKVINGFWKGLFGLFSFLHNVLVALVGHAGKLSMLHPCMHCNDHLSSPKIRKF